MLQLVEVCRLEELNEFRGRCKELAGVKVLEERIEHFVIDVRDLNHALARLLHAREEHCVECPASRRYDAPVCVYLPPRTLLLLPLLSLPFLAILWLREEKLYVRQLWIVKQTPEVLHERAWATHKVTAIERPKAEIEDVRATENVHILVVTDCRGKEPRLHAIRGRLPPLLGTKMELVEVAVVGDGVPASEYVEYVVEYGHVMSPPGGGRGASCVHDGPGAGAEPVLEERVGRAAIAPKDVHGALVHDGCVVVGVVGHDAQCGDSAPCECVEEELVEVVAGEAVLVVACEDVHCAAMHHCRVACTRRRCSALGVDAFPCKRLQVQPVEVVVVAVAVACKDVHAALVQHCSVVLSAVRYARGAHLRPLLALNVVEV
mmetsp:Transcript_65/g.228  ORF Transcript_65/g.228 Transcript_65/m.228 type:complete len:376 (+) Transcript_65:218-1345(+)